MADHERYRRLYDRMAPFYALGQAMVPPWRRYAEEALRFLPESGAVLEIGPGPGLLQRKMHAPGRNLFALDLSAGMLVRVRQRLGSEANLIHADATALPLASASLDAVVLTFVFSAIPEGEDVVRELARVLKSGGRAILVDACVPASGNRVATWLGRQWERFGDQLRDEAALFAAAGLAIDERREFGAFDSIRITVGRKR
ncbi:MAG TPA: class I SAM-dependent methyltransferase [Myxococcales bacterium]|jgi:ubiquinone/menaquinone biosynthesis C-methylase UbiE